MKLVAALPKDNRRTETSTSALGLLQVLALLLLFCSAPAQLLAASQEQQRRPLGSLSTVGEVFVNDLRPPAESTIFAGDILATGPNGTATFAMSGKGTFKVSPQSLLVFAGNPQYLAELKSGTVVMSSFSGAADIILRAGDFSVAPVVQGEQSASKIDRQADGSFLISCLEGSVAVLPLQGPTAGRFLQAGQSLSISPEGELVSPKQTPAPPAGATPSPAPTPTTTPTQPSGKKKSYTGWIILGLAGAGGAGAAAALAGGGGGHPVSPSSP